MFFKKGDFKILIGLAIPLLMGGIIESSLGLTSNIFLAQLGTETFAAGSLVAWFFATLMVIIWGIFTAVSVLVSRYDGAKDVKSISLVMRDSMWMSLLFLIPITLLIWNLAPVLIYLGQKPFIISRATPYMHALAWSVLPDFISLALLQFIVGLGQTRVNLIFTMLWVPINVFCNWIFIFGKFGLPEMGVAGLGWGTTTAFWLLTLALIIYLALRPIYRQYWPEFFTWSKPAYLWELIKVGLPMGLMFFVEVGFFFVLALVMGTKGKDILAANQAAMQFLGFFVTLSFYTAQAVTVRMGNQLGAKQPDVANRAAYAGLIIAFTLLFTVSLFEWLFPSVFLAVDFGHGNHHGDIAVVIDTAIKFLAIGAIFQVIESLRITMFGALRALKDTAYTLFTSFIAFWCVAVPLGFILDIYTPLKAYGFWWALTASSLVNLGLLYFRFKKKMRCEINQPTDSNVDSTN